MSNTLKALFIAVVTVVIIVLVGFGIYQSGKSTGTSGASTSQATSTNTQSTASTASTTQSIQTVTAAQLATHSSSGSDCWVAINGGVYDVTNYSHPKLDPFTCGADNTSGWDSVSRHSTSLLDLVEYMGKLVN